MRAGWIAVTTTVLSLCLSADAGAYCLKKFNANVPFAAWTTLPVTYRVSDNLTDAKLLAAIDAAFQTWGGVPCSKLKFQSGPSFELSSVQFNHGTPYIFIFWHTETSALFDNPGDPTLRLYSNQFVGQNNVGGIVSGSIALNAKDYQWNADGGSASGIFDLQNVMMYLIGGVIGLTNSSVASSVMEDNVTFGQTSKHTLIQDDKDGLLYLYKEDACAAPPAPNSSGCSTGTTPAGDGGTTPSGDGSTITGDGGGAPTGDGSTITGDGGVPMGDGARPCGQCTAEETCVDGVCVPAGDDGGCCRVSHARADRAGGGVLVAALLLVFGLGRRRKLRWPKKR